MVQLRLTQFKTGSKYSPRSYINMNNLTPYQKMELVRCRIWGNTIGDNLPSGLTRFKRSLRRIRAFLYEGAIATDHFPWVDDWEYYHKKKLEVYDRRARILMRGVKIGQRKGIIPDGKMGIFDTKKSGSGTPETKTSA